VQSSWNIDLILASKEASMLLRRNRKIAIPLLAVPLLISTAALADDLSNAIKLCDANTACSYGEADTDGGILFKIKSDGGVVRLYCAADGECARLYPRGQRVATRDPTSVMSLTRALALK
jgi:hypothetical protein